MSYRRLLFSLMLGCLGTGVFLGGAVLRNNLQDWGLCGLMAFSTFISARRLWMLPVEIPPDPPAPKHANVRKLAWVLVGFTFVIVLFWLSRRK